MDLEIDKNLIWTAIIYFAGSFSLGIPWWKAAVIAVVALICWYLTYGRRIIIGIGLAFYSWGWEIGPGWCHSRPNGDKCTSRCLASTTKT